MIDQKDQGPPSLSKKGTTNLVCLRKKEEDWSGIDCNSDEDIAMMLVNQVTAYGRRTY